MTTLFTLPHLRSLLIFFAIVGTFSSISAQDEQQVNVQTEQTSTDNPQYSTSKDARKAALEAQKNANDLRKISLMLAIAQDRDRQAAEAMEDIRSRRLRIEEDLTDAEDNPKNFTKKQRSDLETQYKSLQKKEKLAQKARSTANNFLLEVTQAVAAEPTKRAKFIGTYERKFGPVNDSKPSEISASEVYAASETPKPKAVAVADDTQTATENTPSVSASNTGENAVENTSNTVLVDTKKKKERKPKKNESPKKIAEKEAKKDNESPKNKKITPVFTEESTNRTLETSSEPVVESPVEPVVEPKKEVTKSAKSKPKKKTKKAAKTTDIASNTEGFFNSPIEQNVATTESLTDHKEVAETAINGGSAMDDVVKMDKKSKKSDKKSKKEASEQPQATLVNYRSYDRANDVFMNSPAPECAIAFEGKDEFTGKTKRETAPARFFTHTDDLMRKALLDKDFITCDITGTKVESSRYTYLNLTFTILSKDIQRTLGFLDRGTPIIFVLVDGTKVTLRANKTDIGVVDIDKGTTTYKAQLTAESITDMTGSELDYIRVNWSSGYEDYEVFDVDVLKNLFNCLYKK